MTDALLGDIEIPVIEITDGWPVSDIETIADCEDAFAYLTGALAGIEYQIEAEGFKPLAEQRGEWVARAKSALRFKKAALSIVQLRRSTITRKIEAEARERRDTELLAFIRDALPAGDWLRMVTAFDSGRIDRVAAE